MDWNTFWTIFLQVGISTIFFPVVSFLVGWGLYFIARSVATGIAKGLYVPSEDQIILRGVSRYDD